MSGYNEGTLRREARKRADRAVCGRVISCGRGQERWRTELELCGCKSFDDDHRSAALGTATAGALEERSRFPIRFSVEWRGERRSTVAAERRAFGWRGSRSGGCGRSPWGADEVGSDGETHRARGSSVSADWLKCSKGHLARVAIVTTVGTPIVALIILIIRRRKTRMRCF